MVTKGIIKSIDLLGNTCTVHIPFFETAGNDPIIETATVSNTPGSYNGYKVGDAVYVAFEDGNMSTPVVIGKLYLGTEKEKADPRGVSNVEESTATKKATLPADSKLTAEIDSTVPNTTVPYSSLSSIANGLNKLNTDVGQMDRDYGNRFKQVISNAEGLKSEIEQTAENVVAKVSGYETDISGNPILTEPTEFGWNLQADSWSVFNEDKTILTADKDGLHVAGIIDAESGHIAGFLIKDDGIISYTTSTDEDGKETETPWITNFTNDGQELPSNTSGVYVGTDGIRLGENFSVDTQGNLTTKNLTIAEDATIQGKIHSTNIDVAGLNADGVRVVKKNANGNKVDVNGNEIILPEDATDEEKTEAKAKEIVVFNADATMGTVEMSGFTVENSKLHYYDSNYEYNYGGTTYTGTGVGIGAVPNGGSWAFWAGQQTGDGTTNDWGHDAPFKVSHDGSLFATRGEIGGFKIDATNLSTKDKTFGVEDSLFLSNTSLTGDLGNEYSTDWRFSIGSNFGVKNDGTLYSRNGIFDGEITASSCYLNDVKTLNFTGNELDIGGMKLAAHVQNAGSNTTKNVKFSITSGTVTLISGGRSTFTITITATDAAGNSVLMDEAVSLSEYLRYIYFYYKTSSTAQEVKKSIYVGRYLTFPKGASSITYSINSYTSAQYSNPNLTWRFSNTECTFSGGAYYFVQNNLKVSTTADNVLLECSGGFLPKLHKGGTLGLETKRWGNIYGTNINADGTVTASGTVTTQGNFSAKNTEGTEIFSVKEGTCTAKNFQTEGYVKFKVGGSYYTPAVKLADEASPNCFWSTSISLVVDGSYREVGWYTVSLPAALQGDINKIIAAQAGFNFPNKVTVTSSSKSGTTSNLYAATPPSSATCYVHWDDTSLYIYNPINLWDFDYPEIKSYAKIGVIVLGKI